MRFNLLGIVVTFIKAGDDERNFQHVSEGEKWRAR